MTFLEFPAVLIVEFDIDYFGWNLWHDLWPLTSWQPLFHIATWNQPQLWGRLFTPAWTQSVFKVFKVKDSEVD